MAEGRSWMYTGRQSRTSITPEWAEKAMEFVELAFRRVPPDGCVWCPCACCGNRRKQSKYDMQIHLGKNGFQPDYTVWVYHGESRSSRTAKPSPGDNGNLHGKKDVEVAAAGGEEVSKPQGAKTRKREISLIEAYALSKLRKEERIEWGYQRHLWEKEKLRQQEQQNAPKRPMSRQWMYGDRRTTEFITGLHYFIGVAKENTRDGFMCCPCRFCQNEKAYSSSKILHTHLLVSGFMPSYNCWTKHGERGVVMEHNEEEEDDDSYPMFPKYSDTAAGESEDQEAPKRPRTSGAPTAELAEDEDNKDANSCASSSGSI
ncbi:uncharacterized protein [Lolium perenne]|nr:uncharacterized protein LOC127301466 isoform X1 [Lolium perenne]